MNLGKHQQANQSEGRLKQGEIPWQLQDVQSVSTTYQSSWSTRVAQPPDVEKNLWLTWRLARGWAILAILCNTGHAHPQLGLHTPEGTNLPGDVRDVSEKIVSSLVQGEARNSYQRGSEHHVWSTKVCADLLRLSMRVVCFWLACECENTPSPASFDSCRWCVPMHVPQKAWSDLIACSTCCTCPLCEHKCIEQTSIGMYIDSIGANINTYIHIYIYTDIWYMYT